MSTFFANWFWWSRNCTTSLPCQEANINSQLLLTWNLNSYNPKSIKITLASFQSIIFSIYMKVPGGTLFFLMNEWFVSLWRQSPCGCLNNEFSSKLDLFSPFFLHVFPPKLQVTLATNPKNTPATFKFELHSGQLQALCSTVPGTLHQNEPLKCDLFDVKMQIRCSVCFVEFFGRVSKVFHDMTKYHDVGKIMCTFHNWSKKNKVHCLKDSLENRSMFQSILSLGRMFNHKSHYQVPPV